MRKEINEEEKRINDNLIVFFQKERHNILVTISFTVEYFYIMQYFYISLTK